MQKRRAARPLLPARELNARTGADVAVLQLANPGLGSTIINDVIVAGGAAWFTDSAVAGFKVRTVRSTS